MSTVSLLMATCSTLLAAEHVQLYLRLENQFASATSQNLVTRDEFSVFSAASQLAASKLASCDPGFSW